jgi:hypothetical protein
VHAPKHRLTWACGTTAAAAALLIAASACAAGEAPSPISQARVDQAIGRGLEYLSSKQLEWGEFRSLTCLDDGLKRCRFESSPFATTFVVDVLAALPGDKPASMRKRALDWLLGEQQPGGVWGYWAKRNSDFGKFPADLDDTATVSYALRSAGVSFQDNRAIFDANRDAQKRFLTWIRKDGYNDVDCAVNANVLMYLGESRPEVCGWVVEQVGKGTACAPYYPDPLAIDYLVTRAREKGVTCFAELDPVIGARLSKARQPDGSFGSALDDALAVTIALRTGTKDLDLRPAVEKLLAAQRPEGDWPRKRFFVGPSLRYGSEELTTAFAIEALHRFVARPR